MNMTISDLTNQLIEEAEEYGTGLLDGDSKKANKAEDRFRNLVKNAELNSREILLKPLCEHENVAVRICAATYLLPIQQGFAVSILKECANNKSVVGLMAEAVLDMWKNGQLKV
jgi:hypothetical protein